MSDRDLRGRTALVTGANNRLGIGAAIAKSLAARGAAVFLHYHRTQLDAGTVADAYRAEQTRSADDVIREIVVAGGRAAAHEADFSDTSTISHVFDAPERFCGAIDILINNAAAWGLDTFVPASGSSRNPFLALWSGSSHAMSGESAMKLHAVNAVAPTLLVSEFARRHVGRGARWGRIVNISTAGAACFPAEASYGASKYALESYTSTAAQELGQFGITVNVLALGPVQTGWITPELERALVPTIALGRIGTPQEVADVVLFLASDQARWVTGQKIFVDGGHRA